MSSALACWAASRARHGVVNCESHYLWALNMMRRTASSLIRISRSNKLSPHFSRSSSGLVRQWESCGISRRNSSSRAGCGAASARGNSFGSSHAQLGFEGTEESSLCRLLRAWPIALRRRQAVSFSFVVCLKSNGTRFSPMPIRVISPGNSIRVMDDVYSKTLWRTAVVVDALRHPPHERRPGAVSGAGPLRVYAGRRVSLRFHHYKGNLPCDLYVSTRRHRARAGFLSSTYRRNGNR